MERRLAARYVLHEEVGVGGTARVHRGRDEHLDRPVAVKVLDTRLAASADPAGRERFLRECRTAAVVDHPAAVTVYDAGEDGDDLYLVMELIDGETLAQRLARGPLPLHEALHVAQRLLAVLGAAHAKGIVHRDVKPSNVLLGGNGLVKLSDFGIAKRFDELETSVTSTGMVIGTPRYLAPEQAAGSPTTPAVDIYAVGVLLFEMLAGRPPFSGESAIAIAVAQQTAPVPDVRSERPDVPSTVADAITTALSADPAARPATAEQFARSLTASPVATAEMPALAVPMAPDATTVTHASMAADATTAMIAPVVPGPATVGSGRAPQHAGTPPRVRSGRRSPLALIGLGLLVVFVLVGALALALGERDEPGLLAADATGTTGAAEATTDTTVPTSVDEIVPGFPRTDDLLVFLAQLETTPDMVGDGGAELGRELRRALVEEDEDRRRERVGELRRWLPQFVADGHVHPDVASALDTLLAPLDVQHDDDEDDDDDDRADRGNGRGNGNGNGRGNDD